MNIVVKVAKGKSIIDFKLYNHKVDRAVTYRELKLKVDSGKYNLVLLEEIDRSKLDIIRDIKGRIKVALVCGRINEYVEQAEIARSVGIDVISQSGEVDDYINKISGKSVRFTGQANVDDIDTYKDDTAVPVENEVDMPKVIINDDIDAVKNDDTVNNNIEVSSEDVIKVALKDVTLEGNKEEAREIISDREREEDSTIEKILSAVESGASVKAVNEGVALGIGVSEVESAVASGASVGVQNETEQDRFTESNKEMSAEILLDRIEQYKRQCNEFEKEIGSLTERLGTAIDERDTYKDNLDDSVKNCNKKEEEIVGLNAKIEVYVADLARLKCTNKELNDKVSVLEKSVENLQQSLNTEVSQLSGEKLNIKGSLDSVKNELHDTVTNYNNLVNRVVGVRLNVIEAIECYSSAGNEVEGLTNESVDVYKILLGVESVCTKFIDVYNKEVAEADELNTLRDLRVTNEQEIESLTSSVESLRNDVELKSSEISRSSGEIEALKDKLKVYDINKAKEFREIRVEVDKYKVHCDKLSSDCTTFKEQIESKDAYISELAENVIKLEQDCTEKETKIVELNASVEALKLTAGANLGSGGTISLSNGYSGSAKIIQVFGSGSYGVTTVAMTLAHRFIGKKVLYIDFDLVSPKADSWFNINPVCESLIDIKTQIDKTGIAALINNGTSYVIRNFDKIVKHKVNKREFKLDYFSGIYNTPISSKVYSVDYTLLFKFLSDKYDYIVVDSGRIGSSDAYDSVIRTINDMAYKNIVVTLSDKFDVRTQKVKINYTGIDLSKCIWLLNMGDNNIIETDVKKMIGDIKIIKLTKVLNYYGIKKPMDIAVPMLKMKFDEIMRYINK